MPLKTVLPMADRTWPRPIASWMYWGAGRGFATGHVPGSRGSPAGRSTTRPAPSGHRVARDAVGVHIVDRTEAELALRSGVLGGQPGPANPGFSPGGLQRPSIGHAHSTKAQLRQRAAHRQFHPSVRVTTVTWDLSAGRKSFGAVEGARHG